MIVWRMSKSLALALAVCLGIAHSASAEHAYVVDLSVAPASIYTIDASTCSIVNTIQVPNTLYGVAAGSNRAYVSLPHANEVWAIDDGTGQVAGQIAVGNFPSGLALLPNESKLFVANQCGPTACFANHTGSVSVIDTVTLTVLDTVPVGTGPFGLVTSRNGARLFVTDEEANTLVVMNTSNNLIMRTIPVGTAPRGVAVDRAGRVVVANFRSDSVSIIDPAAGTVLGTVAVGRGPYAVATHPTVDRAYVTNSYDHTVSIIDTAARVVVATTASNGFYPGAVAMGRNGRLAFVVNSYTPDPSDGGNLMVLDTSQNIIVKTCVAQIGGVAAGGFGDFITKVSPMPPSPPFPTKFCPPRVCRMIPIREDVKLCSLDPMACLPPQPFCDPRCAKIDCCGLRDPGELDARRPGVFVSWVGGGRVRKADGVDIRRAGTKEFVPLKPGTVLGKGDFLRLSATSQLTVDAKGASIQTPEGGLPETGPDQMPWLLLAAGPPPQAKPPRATNK
jgi:YVTN family beta-propeller protein